MYCNACGEFFAFAVEDDRLKGHELEFTADAPILVECPFCKHQERRHIAEVRRIPLTEGNKRKDIAQQK
jgi:hypothetical protein